jgi:tRNA dimethylallyltransferase
MNSRPATEAIVITGPTGAGKTTLAVEVAEQVGGSIISADSRQVYRGMDIGTAKPGPELRKRLPHNGLDLVDPDEGYSAGRFARDAWVWIDQITADGRVPVIAGGTGFFIRSLLEPLGPEPDLEPERRDDLRRYLSGLAPDELKRWLRRLDPLRASRFENEGGGQRLSRSLEVALLSGQPHTRWLERPPETRALSALVFCLELPREVLYERINARFDRMMEQGLLDEVRGLLERHSTDAPGLDSLGYAELARHVHGELSLEEAVEEAKRNTRRFAKRQMTWFRHQLPEGAVWLDGRQSIGQLVASVLSNWQDPTLETR